MGDTPIQPISAFHKENYASSLALELSRNKNTFHTVKLILCIWLDPKTNLVHQSETIRALISRLTGDSRRAISASLKDLVDAGFARKIDDYTYQVNPRWINKTTSFMEKKIGYTGKSQNPNATTCNRVGNIMSYAPKSCRPKQIETERREKMLEDKIKGLEESTKSLEHAATDLKISMNENFKKILDMLNNGKVEETKRHLELVVVDDD